MSQITGMVIECPTLRINSNERPQRNFRAIGGGVLTIVIQFTHDLPTVFLHFLLQSPLHQAQQVAVQQDFIFRINRRDRNLRSREWY